MRNKVIFKVLVVCLATLRESHSSVSHYFCNRCESGGVGVGVGVSGGVCVFYIISLLLDSSSRKSVERVCVCVCVCGGLC